ncbi:hypothetical protein B0A69_16765 [Chryseobacterium shigense]|uniref:DUF3601 domain-containing protein n=1 Tax=Chryseobacterium shigense TaxID=297244 RepID=A0A1N7IEF0_9FLAO|nr:hypothetical protein B0A69_16765 [Chryseobacterium shigense]SIS35449.1 hypothetical protein SAMN05421639_103294 [Chryseobacterium shigense]
MKHKYDYLLNQGKAQVLKLMGHEFNFYPSDKWTYVVETGCFYRKTVLFIFFENENVSKIEIKKMYGKIRTQL